MFKKLLLLDFSNRFGVKNYTCVLNITNKCNFLTQQIYQTMNQSVHFNKRSKGYLLTTLFIKESRQTNF